MAKFNLKLTAAICINGGIVVAGTIIEAEKALAEDLLHRGKAELLDESEPASGGEVVNLSKMNKAQLEELAIDYNIDPEGKTNAQLIEAIKAAAV